MPFRTHPKDEYVMILSGGRGRERCCEASSFLKIAMREPANERRAHASGCDFWVG
jgi:hypothetical protein